MDVRVIVANINVGVLVSSRDKQSQDRKITINLGFSSFLIPLSDFKGVDGAEKNQYVQITLVDCPGHASLIKTVVAGAATIDLILLVIDATKGMQVQTAECLIISELLCRDLVVVLNKVDLLEKKPKKMDKLIRTLRSRVFSKTKFGKDVKMCKVSALQGKVDEINDMLKKSLFIPHEQYTNPKKYAESFNPKEFVLAVDHWFPIKGVGTVVTGTCLSGRVNERDEVEFPLFAYNTSVKSIQIYHKNATHAIKNDRIALSLNGFPQGKIPQKFLIASPGALTTFNFCIASISTVKFFTKIKSFRQGSTVNIMIGQRTVTAKFEQFFSGKADEKENSFDFAQTYEHLPEVNFNQQYNNLYAIIFFQQTVAAQSDAQFLMSKLELENSNRFCFYGQLVPKSLKKVIKQRVSNMKKTYTDMFPELNIVKYKHRTAQILKLFSMNTLIGSGFAQIKDLNYFLDTYIGKSIDVCLGDQIFSGTIQSVFGKAKAQQAPVKFKVLLDEKCQHYLETTFEGKKMKEIHLDGSLRYNYTVNVF